MIQHQKSRRKTAAMRLLCVLLAFILCTSTCISLTRTSYAAGDEITVETMKKSIDKVIQSVDELKDVMSPEEKSAIKDIFNGFISVASPAISVISAINISTTFLKLIGVMKDPQAAAMANIVEQLKQINEKLDVMDKKLDAIKEQMIKMEAKGEFEHRTDRAVTMLKNWNDFETHYMEEQMDELMREHNALMLDRIEQWIEYKTKDARPADGNDPHTDKIVLLYSADQNWEVQYTLENSLTRDPSSADRFMILDKTFLPAKGAISWNVNTYRADLAAFIRVKLSALRDSLSAEPEESQVPEAGAAGEAAADFEVPAAPASEGSDDGFFILEDDLMTVEPAAVDPTEEEPGDGEDPNARHYKLFNISPADWTDEEVAQYASDAADSIIYRLNWYAVNESADFSTKVYKQFMEYCNHLTFSQQGMDALLKTFYLTHAFEFEAVEDIKAFCNQMMLKTGVYGMFAMNILGLSKYITDAEKLDAAQGMCDAIDDAQRLQDDGITGNGRYCYVTNSIIEYGDASFTGTIDIQYSRRGTYASYISYSGANISSDYNYDHKTGSSPIMLGDANAVVLAYHIAANGGTFDQDYMNEHLTTNKRTKRSAVITSIGTQQQLPLDASCRLKTHNVIGNYYDNDPTITLNSLPGSSESQYLIYRNGIKGSLYTGGISVPQADKVLIGTAGYGESHWYWNKDESAVMGGPSNESSFSEQVPPPVRTGSSIRLDDYYTQHYSNSTVYNCLVQIPLDSMTATPLTEFETYMLDVKARSELETLILDAQEAVGTGNWSVNSLARIQKAVSGAEACLANEEASADDLVSSVNQLSEALEKLTPIKQVQDMTLNSPTQSLTVSDLKEQDQIVNGLAIENAAGEVSFELRSVHDEAYSDMFQVDPQFGYVTIRQGLPAGTYTLSIRAAADGNDEYYPASVTGNLKISVNKKAQAMKATAKAQTLKAEVLKDQSKTVAPLTVKGAVGKVTYSLTSVSNTKYQSKFAVNEKTGKVTVKKGLPGGTYTLKIKVSAAGDDEFKAKSQTVSVRFTIIKTAQNMTVTVAAPKVAASVLKTQNKTLSAITLKNAKGTVSYSLTSVSNTKYQNKFAVNASTGKITVKKGLPAGTHTLKIKVSAAGNSVYKPASKTVSVKITVK